MAGHAEEINLFKSLTGTDDATASNYLESMDWNVQVLTLLTYHIRISAVPGSATAPEAFLVVATVSPAPQLSPHPRFISP